MRLWILDSPRTLNEILDVNKLRSPTKIFVCIVFSYKTTTFSSTVVLSTTSNVLTTSVSLPQQQQSMLPTTTQMVPLRPSSTVPNVRSTQPTPVATEEPETGVYLSRFMTVVHLSHKNVIISNEFVNEGQPQSPFSDFCSVI